MAEKGLTLLDVAEIVAANDVRADPTANERQRRCRANKKTGHAVTVTRDTVSPNDNLTPSGTILPNEASASLPVRQPISEAKDCWNENAATVGWPQVRTLSANRQKLLAARLREHGLDGWQGAIAKARASPYLAGPDPPSWFTFPWLIKSENFLKTIEGNYDRRHADNSGNTTGSALAKVFDHIGGSVAQH